MFLLLKQSKVLVSCFFPLCFKDAVVYLKGSLTSRRARLLMAPVSLLNNKLFVVAVKQQKH